MTDPDYTQTIINTFGAFFLGAVYLGGCIAAGIAWDIWLATVLAIASAGVGYMAQIAAELYVARMLVGALWFISVMLGISAAMAIVFGA